MEPAAHDDGRLTIIEADTIQLLPAARRQLECLLDAAAIARITQLADPTMAWPDGDAEGWHRRVGRRQGGAPKTL